jgi:putative glycosyltransferase (TIGR04372 family)
MQLTASLLIDGVEHVRLQLLRELILSATGSPRAIFEIGRRAAHRGELDWAVKLYASALNTCIKLHESPLIHGSDEIMECMYNIEERSRPYWPLLLRLVAHELLANDLINHLHDFKTAHRVMMERLNLQKSSGLSSSTLYLSDEWTRNIGHIGTLANLVKLQELGLSPWKQIVVAAKKQRVANAALLRQLSSHVQWISDPEEVTRLEPLTILSGFRMTALIEGFAAKPLTVVGEMECFAEAAWRNAGRSALLVLTEEQREQARSLLATLGIPKDAWIVCLHVREDSFHASGSSQTHGSANIVNYMAAIEGIAARGGWVIRMGDPAMSPAPTHPRLIDWAHSSLRSAEGDVLLAGACRFAIAGNSGFVYLLYSFGRPIILSDAPITPGTGPFGPGCILLPKLIRQGDRPLSFKELFSPQWREAAYSIRGLVAMGAQCVDNTPDEIAAATEEMLDDQRSSREICDFSKSFVPEPPCTARISKYFLRKHSELL